ncbi:MAG TPA: hypothetical protein VN040_03015, partial [Pseudosphingobacterium sp.]|nr:hypothetical protein [Pseudosphingobacterium sp.]
TYRDSRTTGQRAVREWRCQRSGISVGAAVTGYTGTHREIVAMQRHSGPNGMPLASNSFNLQHLPIMSYELSRVMEDNLDQVWNEKDPAVRLKAIKKIYGESATLNHVADQVTGFDAINESVSTTQKVLLSNFVFTRPVSHPVRRETTVVS